MRKHGLGGMLLGDTVHSGEAVQFRMWSIRPWGSMGSPETISCCKARMDTRLEPTKDVLQGQAS